MDYQRLYCDLKTELALEINNLKMSNNETEAQVARSLENIYNRNNNLYDKMIEEDCVKCNINTDYIKISDGTRIPGSAVEMLAEAISTFEEMVKKKNTDNIKIPQGPRINANFSPEEIKDIKDAFDIEEMD